jgi:nucleotide sugar dehydrogenase
MKIGIIGAGRLGLTFALLCEKAGYEVIVSDKREDYVYNLNHGICDTNEPLIQKMLFEVNNFSATTSNIEIIENTDIIFTFVATPSTTDGSYDTSAVFEVANDFFTASKMEISIFNKKFIVGCTTNPGDVEQLQNKLSMFSIQVAYNPEFIAQGEIVKGLEQSDIVLIGTEYQELANELVQIYNKIQTTPVHAHIMSPKAAEITKIGINCFLTTKISYANMMGDILTKSNLGSEIDVVLNAIGGDTRVGKKYMKYGFGFGGPCLPRDNRALGHYANELGLKLNLPLTVDEFNKEHAEFIKNFFIKQNPDKTIPFVMNYVTYKRGTDILEESQQFKLCLDLLEEGYYVNVIEIDPVIKQLSDLSEQYNNRLKFYKPGTTPEGFVINLQ